MEEPAAASAALLESSSHAGVTLPELSRSQTTLDECLDAPTPTVTKRKSLRTRPSEVWQQQQDAAVPSPLRPTTPQRLELRSRSSKMSLFNLFSKPKVEKQRGYAESGLETSPTQRAMSLTNAGPLKPDLIVRVQSADTEKARTRPTSSKSYAPKKSRLYTSKEPLPQIPQDRHTRHLDPPPLFQVWPQSIKSATLEVSTSASDISAPKTKSRIAATLMATPTDARTGSAESRISLPSRNGSISGIALPKKAIVLTTSGHLLQYAETGQSDRLPEKILQLGKDSAAFASDLIPGKHHVLQVSQAVDSSGISVMGSQTLLSRFSIRRLPTSRFTSTFLLVMSGPDELNEWMSAVKKSIEEYGGKRVRPDTAASRPKSRHPQPDVTRTPSHSHRFQVKRDPEGPSPLMSPKLDATPSPPLPVLQLDLTEKELPNVPEITNASAEKLEVQDADNESIKTRPRAPSDCPSISSSTALSVEQQQLDKLRNSVRMSHTSTVATSVTASRTNSVTSSPSDQYPDGLRESALAKPPYRALSSYTLAKRRSGAQLSLKELPEGVNPIALMHQQRLALVDGAVDSPVLGLSPPLPEPSPSPGHNRLSFARSTPDLKTMTAVPSKRDSKLALPPADGRPASFIADLPDPTIWASKPSPSQARMSSSIPFPPLLETTTVKSHNRTSSGASRTSPTSRPLRSGSNSFSLPRSVPGDSSPPRSQQRSPSDAQEEQVLSPVPAVHTLTAKVDVATRTKIDDSYIPARKSSTSGSPPTIRSAKRATAKLSLFPSAPSAPPPIFPQTDILRRSPSAAALSAHMRMQPYVSSATPRRLARPASLQVRSNHAPFVSAIRSQNDVTDARSFATTAPIRSLKPSRSIATMQTTTSSSPALRSLSSFTPHSIHAETIDEISPLPSRVTSPTPSRTRKSPRTSTQSIDISSLGPPAPPPSTPLPELPTGNVSPERRGSKDRLSVIQTAIPTDVAIGQGLESSIEVPPRKGSAHKTTGLGIAVVKEEETTKA